MPNSTSFFFNFLSKQAGWFFPDLGKD